MNALVFFLKFSTVPSSQVSLAEKGIVWLRQPRLFRGERNTYMAKKLFVGSLPFTTTSEELNKLFSEVGEVESANVITDRMSGRSRGFGFVEMAKDEDATKAVEKFNGFDMNGRNIVVNEARPREERPNG